VFHIEAFVVPRRGSVSLARLEDAHERIVRFDWKVQDVQVIPVRELPEEAER